jgi:hypothetical protein
LRWAASWRSVVQPRARASLTTSRSSSARAGEQLPEVTVNNTPLPDAVETSDLILGHPVTLNPPDQQESGSSLPEVVVNGTRPKNPQVVSPPLFASLLPWNFGSPQGNQLPCSAANNLGQGVLIQIGFTNANSSGSAIPGVDHTFVIAADPTTGAVYASRGGPGSGQGGGPGIGPATFVAVSRPYNAGFPDYGSVGGVQTVGYVNAPYGQVTSYLDTFAAATNANSLAYLGPIQNSNSYTSALLSGLGFKPPTPALRAPGYGTNSPSGQLQCTKP